MNSVEQQSYSAPLIHVSLNTRPAGPRTQPCGHNLRLRLRQMPLDEAIGTLPAVCEFFGESPETLSAGTLRRILREIPNEQFNVLVANILAAAEVACAHLRGSGLVPLRASSSFGPSFIRSFRRVNSALLYLPTTALPDPIAEVVKYICDLQRIEETAKKPLPDSVRGWIDYALNHGLQVGHAQREDLARAVEEVVEAMPLVECAALRLIPTMPLVIKANTAAEYAERKELVIGFIESQPDAVRSWIRSDDVEYVKRCIEEPELAQPHHVRALTVWGLIGHDMLYRDLGFDTFAADEHVGAWLNPARIPQSFLSERVQILTYANLPGVERLDLGTIASIREHSELNNDVRSLISNLLSMSQTTVLDPVAAGDRFRQIAREQIPAQLDHLQREITVSPSWRSAVAGVVALSAGLAEFALSGGLSPATAVTAAAAPLPWIVARAYRRWKRADQADQSPQREILLSLISSSDMNRK